MNKPSDKNGDSLEVWLRTVNENYRRQEIPPVQRPFKAVAELSVKTGQPIRLDSGLAGKVFAWFQANTKPGSHAIGAMFTGAFYYDTCFWPVTIPIGYGRFHLDPLNGLETMPPALREGLWQDPVARSIYLQYWADCFDYAYGADLLLKPTRLDARAHKFFQNADAELRKAVAALLTLRPTLKAILDFRMATEIFLKSFLIQEKNLADPQLRALRHDIDRLAKACFEAKADKEFQFIEQGSKLFPDIAERYEGEAKPSREVFDAAFLAQRAAATITRHFSSQDIRPQIWPRP